MLLLLGVKTHPAIRVLIGAIALAVGLVVHADLMAAAGVVLLLYGGFSWYRRVRANARREEARAWKNGTARRPRSLPKTSPSCTGTSRR